jgi:elongation factor Ts
VAAFVDPSGKAATLLELNSETDFVARTDDFQRLVLDLAKEAAEKNWKSPADAPAARIQELAAKLGENIVLRRFERFEKKGPGLFAAYIHPSGGTGKVGVLLELGADGDAAAGKEEARALAKDLSMQVAAASPRWVKREDVPADTIEQEKSIAREQAKRENKPEKIWDKISQGKLQQFYQQFCLLDQPYVKEPGGKVTVGEVVEKVSKTAGGKLMPVRFVRYRVGEEE